MVEGLQREGKDVRYVIFPDEGHGRSYGNWRNLVRQYRAVEVRGTGAGELTIRAVRALERRF
jgi:hypothetical protein